MKIRIITQNRTPLNAELSSCVLMFIVQQMSIASKLGISSEHAMALYYSAALLDREDFAESIKWRGVLMYVPRSSVSSAR